ncbi:hypothetical protein J6590_004322 [Homalodisca vitripennis]|nr:hypothetical protein J6590_004322 [Homalodisca vitripennis]
MIFTRIHKTPADSSGSDSGTSRALLGCGVALAYPMAAGPMPDPYAYGTYGSMGGPDPFAMAGYGGPDPFASAFASPYGSAGAMPFQRTGPQPYGAADPFGQPSYSYSF